jgi:hypothetical protein
MSCRGQIEARHEGMLARPSFRAAPMSSVERLAAAKKVAPARL